MTVLRWTLAEAVEAIEGPDIDRLVGAAVGVPGVVVEVSDGGDPRAQMVANRLTKLPVVAIAESESEMAQWDVVAAEVASAVSGLTDNPQAAVVAAQVLRATEGTSTMNGLLTESLAYATLHGGVEFATWLNGRGRRSRRPDDESRVVVDENDEAVTVTLNRPRLHNMLDVAMRDELVEVLRALSFDGTDRPISLRGAGPAFCAGGDTGEFGIVTDAPTGHLVRATANVAPWLDRLSSRITAHLDGAAVGAGIELAAFCGRIEATSAARFALPELSMGLIPGAGGTVSIPRRIGRQRTLLWLLTNRELTADQAFEWGLVDVMVD